jgi:hypothetical protein
LACASGARRRSSAALRSLRLAVLNSHQGAQHGQFTALIDVHHRVGQRQIAGVNLLQGLFNRLALGLGLLLLRFQGIEGRAVGFRVQVVDLGFQFCQHGFDGSQAFLLFVGRV